MEYDGLSQSYPASYEVFVNAPVDNLTLVIAFDFMSKVALYDLYCVGVT
jgi:hypothetical protein